MMEGLVLRILTAASVAAGTGIALGGVILLIRRIQLMFGVKDEGEQARVTVAR